MNGLFGAFNQLRNGSLELSINFEMPICDLQSTLECWFGIFSLRRNADQGHSFSLAYFGMLVCGFSDYILVPEYSSAESKLISSLVQCPPLSGD